MQKHFYNLRYQADEIEWRARAKRGLLIQTVKKYLPVKKRLTMLDVGCGTGVTQIELSKNFKLNAFGIDSSRQAIAFAKKRGLTQVSVGTAQKIRFPAAKFDLVTALDVLEHLSDDLTALRQIYRVLKPGGVGIFLVPAHLHLWSTRDMRLKHFRRYNPGQLERQCRQANLRLIETKNVDFLLYFFFRLVHAKAKRSHGVADLGWETVMTKPLLNRLLYMYEMAEVSWLKSSNFPIGLSTLVVVRKPTSWR